MLISETMDLNELGTIIGESKGPIPSLDVSRKEQLTMLRERLMLNYGGTDISVLIGARMPELYDPIPINACSVCGAVPTLAIDSNGNRRVQCDKHESEVFASAPTWVTAVISWNQIIPTFCMFKKLITAARPDLNFKFSDGGKSGNHQAKWVFPGAVYGGGSVCFPYGSTELSWGMSRGDLDAWEVFEISQGRKPRWT